MTRLRRSGAIAGLALVWLTAAAAPALADPPGPTDYQTEVVEIDPVTAGFRVEVIGGDSFILVEAEPGTTIEVVGYRGEPYLRFHPDGRVEENGNSPTTYLNIDRYGIADIPAGANADATPDWVLVATDGSYAWHDHRAHWMNEADPPGRQPGDVILEGVVPLVVDGVEVDVSVISVWQPAPSMAAPLGGMALGLAAVAGAALRRARVRSLALLLGALALPAAVMGLVAMLSVPAETAPPWSLWVPPLVAAVLALVAVAGRFTPALERWSSSAALIGSLVLGAWAILHLEWLWSAVLPTAAPFWLDRLVAGAVLAGSVGLVALVGRAQLVGDDA